MLKYCAALALFLASCVSTQTPETQIQYAIFSSSNGHVVGFENDGTEWTFSNFLSDIKIAETDCGADHCKNFAFIIILDPHFYKNNDAIGDFNVSISKHDLDYIVAISSDSCEGVCYQYLYGTSGLEWIQWISSSEYADLKAEGVFFRQYGTFILPTTDTDR